MSIEVIIYQGEKASRPTPATPPARYVLSLDAAIAAWLKNKSERTGSAKTKRAYQDTITGKPRQRMLEKFGQ